MIITCFAAYIMVEQWCQKSKSKIFRYQFWYIQYQVHIFNIMKYIYIYPYMGWLYPVFFFKCSPPSTEVWPAIPPKNALNAVGRPRPLEPSEL